jgi:hypothetical protein
MSTIPADELAPDDEVGDAARDYERLRAQWLDELRQVGRFDVVGDGLWFGYRPNEVVADARGRAILQQLVAADAVEVDDDLGLQRLVVPPQHDPLSLSLEVRERDPQARAAPNYLVVPGHHMGFFPHNLPVPARAAPNPPPAADLDPTITIGVVDTGCLRRHPWWAPQRPAIPADSFETAPASASQVELGHGTFITGVLRQRAPAVGILHDAAWVQPLAQAPIPLATEWSTAKSILAVAAAGARVINVSMGTYAPQPLPPESLRGALDFLELQHRDDVVVIASAGNDSTDRPLFPAAYKPVVAVGAAFAPVGAPLQRASYSNFGWWVDACAWGSWTSSYFRGRIRPLGARFDSYARWSGTSFAAPAVAATVALEAAATGKPPRKAARDLIAAKAAVHVADLGTYFA